MITEINNDAAHDSSEQASKRRGIGLCLSGGGYRAALFHLGALRRLHEIGILEQITHVSSVSGGSLIAAIWAKVGKIQDFDLEIAKPVRALSSTNIRTTAFLKQFLNGNAGIEHIAHCLEPYLGDNTLVNLPETPEFIFCATDLGFGVNWEFSKKQVGSYRAGISKTQAEKWKLSTVAAISAAFPPVFNPYRVPYDSSFKNAKKSPNYNLVWQNLTLNDGGNYDNLGLEPLWKDCETLLVSDGGTPFQAKPSGWLGERLSRYFGVLDSQARGLRRRMLHIEYERNLQGVYWSMKNTTPNLPNNFTGYSADFAENIISQTRTDFDTFEPFEQAILENHGYTVIEGRLSQMSKQNKTQTCLAHLNPQVVAFRLPHPELEYQEANISEARRRSLISRTVFGRGWDWFGGKR